MNYHWLRSLVKHIVATKHGSFKPLTSNELWPLELRIKSTRILAPIPDALWDMCKSFIYHSQLHISMEVYSKALLVLSLKVPGELYNAPKNNSPIKAWYRKCYLLGGTTCYILYSHMIKTWIYMQLIEILTLIRLQCLYGDYDEDDDSHYQSHHNS